MVNLKLSEEELKKLTEGMCLKLRPGDTVELVPVGSLKEVADYAVTEALRKVLEFVRDYENFDITPEDFEAKYRFESPYGDVHEAITKWLASQGIEIKEKP